MFDIEIKFVIFSLDVKDDQIQPQVLSSNKNQFIYPSIKLDSTLALNNAKKLCFENYISLKLEWIEHKLLDIVQENNTISIYYVCNIPIESKLTNGFFIPTHQVIFDPVLQKARSYI